jgi:hypothetical protein
MMKIKEKFVIVGNRIVWLIMAVLFIPAGLLTVTINHDNDYWSKS